LRLVHVGSSLGMVVPGRGGVTRSRCGFADAKCRAGGSATQLPGPGWTAQGRGVARQSLQVGGGLRLTGGKVC
jgi:hypothetical protein